VNKNPDRDGFTLFEILVAMAIIVAIVSMMYGSYFVTSKSIRVCKDKLSLSQQGQMVLTEMSRQIRCSYARCFNKPMSETASAHLSAKPADEPVIDYFSGNSDAPNGEILHLVTTNDAFGGKQEAGDGLFEVTYKFDKSRCMLFVNSKGFVSTSRDDVGKGPWRPIAKNVKAVELSFFDGRQWLGNWDFRNNGQPPCAVKIEIVSMDKNGRQYQCGTVADLLCRKNRAEKTRADILVSVGK
jgi:prepilin-type N-terminal cleavage/methylation domain-containing protein